jgi:hypothetical protein
MQSRAAHCNAMSAHIFSYMIHIHHIYDIYIYIYIGSSVQLEKGSC